MLASEAHSALEWVMFDDVVDEKVIHKLSMATEEVMYENMCLSYASTLRNREVIIERMGPKTLRGQQLLGVGLTLTTIASIVMIMTIIASAV